MQVPENNLILIVDDEIALRESYRDILCPDQQPNLTSTRLILKQLKDQTPATTYRKTPLYKIVEADNGTKALETVRDSLKQGKHFAGAFVDVRMPGAIDGLTFIQEAWKLDPDLQVVIVTAYQDRGVDEINTMFSEKMQDQWDYLNKPFTSGEVAQKARQMTSIWNRRQRERLYLKSIEQQQKLATAGRIARSIGHELSNILQPLVTKLEVLGDNELLETAELASFLCRDLLTFGHDSLSDDSIPQTLELKVTLEKAIRLLKHNLKAKDIKLSMNIPDTITVKGIQNRLTQVFVNLINNSIQAMKDGGTLKIQALQDNYEVAVQIQDSGCGIPQENLRRVFEPLFTTKGENGHGIGLGVCKTIIEGFGGSITIDSHVGQGTTVTIQLPASA